MALLYTQKLRKAPNGQSTLAALKTEPLLKNLLINVMETGWTTAKEKEAIGFLKAL